METVRTVRLGKVPEAKQPMTRLELERLRAGMAIERSSFLSHWQELGQFILPRRTRFITSDRDRGNRRNYAIINSTAGLAARTLRAGMMSGFTSPSRPWFRLTTADPDMTKLSVVQEWLYDVTWAMSDMFLRSNLYTSLQTVYGDMGVFGTACMLIMEDFERVIHTYPFVIGSYYLAADYKLKINVFMRDYQMTVRQIVGEFVYDEATRKYDWSHCSEMVKSLWYANNTETWIDVVHAILPNPDYNPDSKLSEKKKYLSVYYERGSTNGQYSISMADSDKTMRKKGFDKFRILAPRWEVSGEDIYGTYCPGMEALGDQQGLQVYERRGAMALEKSINPAMVAPSTMRNQKATVVPGDITYVDSRDGQQKFEPAYLIQPNFQQLNLEKVSIMERINECFHKDLWLVVSNLDKGNVTAEEIRALQNEKLQEVGPVVDRLNQDLLDPLVEQSFDIMVAQGRIPPPPPEMRKMPLKVEYTSIIAQAQKALAAGGIEQFTGYALKLKEMHPEDPSVLDKFNIDEALDRYGEDLSIPPGILRDDDDVAAMRQERAQAQAKQQQLADAEAASKAAKNLATSPTDGSNALSDLIQRASAGNMLPGSGAPPPNA